RVIEEYSTSRIEIWPPPPVATITKARRRSVKAKRPSQSHFEVSKSKRRTPVKSVGKNSAITVSIITTPKRSDNSPKRKLFSSPVTNERDDTSSRSSTTVQEDNDDDDDLTIRSDNDDIICGSDVLDENNEVTDDCSGEEWWPPSMNNDDTPEIGTHVFAKWTDSHFYPGIVSDVMGNKFSIEFDDGARRQVKLNEIICRSYLEPNQDVMAQTQDGYFDHGVIKRLVKKKNGKLGYVVEKHGHEKWYPTRKIMLSMEQIGQLPNTPRTPQAENADNITSQGKRKRTSSATQSSINKKSKSSLSPKRAGK
ncbi:unnamed protein product, partial [Didymodactylos carnosus]